LGSYGEREKGKKSPDNFQKWRTKKVQKVKKKKNG
jgi:hypothetical protein